MLGGGGCCTTHTVRTVLTIRGQTPAKPSQEARTTAQSLNLLLIDGGLDGCCSVLQASGWLLIFLNGVDGSGSSVVSSADQGNLGDDGDKLQMQNSTVMWGATVLPFTRY